MNKPVHQSPGGVASKGDTREALTWDEIRQRLNRERIADLGISPDRVLGTRWVSPAELVIPKHFDLVAKHIYARFREQRLQSDWGRRVYNRHIFAFNGYEEGDGTGKRGPEAFFWAFDALLESIGKVGFDVSRTLVPVTRSGFVLDGGHRVAACAYYHRDVAVVEVDVDGSVWDYRFFQDRGMPVKYMDSVALEYCHLKRDTCVVLVFPSAGSRFEEVTAVLERHGCVAYEKQIYLTQVGASNLMRELKGAVTRAGTESNESDDLEPRVAACFGRHSPLVAYIFTPGGASSREELLKELFAVGGESIYLTQAYGEALELAQVLLNDNSIYFLNHANPVRQPDWAEFLERYRASVVESKKDPGDFCLTGDATLGAFGLRDMVRVDFLFRREPKTKFEPAGREDEIETRNWLPFTQDDLIYNPENHFYHQGLKFVSLKPLRRMKLAAASAHDRADARMIQRKLAHFALSEAWARIRNPKHLLSSIRKTKSAIANRYVMYSAMNALKGALGQRVRIASCW